MVKDNVMLSEKVANQILKMIMVDKKFNIGDKLLNENELSSDLGVSRTTLRAVSYTHLTLPTTERV